MTGMDLAMLKGVEALDVRGKRVLLRADLNVPMADGEVSDATRIERILPAIRSLSRRGATVLVISHFGRPKGRRRKDLSLRPVAEKMKTMLNGTQVWFVEDCVGDKAAEGIRGLTGGEVAVLENLRFHPGEETNDGDFAVLLSALGDIYVNDAFSCSHRAHASTEAITRLMPAYAGPLMTAEIEALRRALEAPERPVAAVVGGAKVSTKIPVLTNLAEKVDLLVVGGGMANTFLHALDIDVGTSLCELDFANTVREIMERAKEAGCRIVLPIDAVVADKFEAGASNSTCAIDAVPPDMMILDVGPDTVDLLNDQIRCCKTLLWNGPLGAFEAEPFGEGTFALASEAARLTRAGALVTVAGGGDTIAALNTAGVTQDFTYVSTAGGAFLEWLEGRELPGVAALIGQQEQQAARSA